MNADTMYTLKQHAILAGLTEIEKRIKSHAEKQASDTLNWEYVGDLSEVNDRVNAILTFLGE